MSAGNFERALAEILHHEGGWVNDKQDPGGETNYGITKATALAHGYRGSMRTIPMPLVERIYRRSYWAAVRGDDLPTGVDLAVFDFAVNSGPQRAAEFLQRRVRVQADGRIGPITLSAVAAADPEKLAADLCAARLTWLRKLKTWPRFGRGWTARVVDVLATAVEWIAKDTRA